MRGIRRLTRVEAGIVVVTLGETAAVEEVEETEEGEEGVEGAE